MKTIFLLLVGLLPLPVGYYFNHLILSGGQSSALLSAGTIGIGFLLVWFILGAISGRVAVSVKQAMSLTHTAAFAVLFLNLYQELILRQYWPNMVGSATQFFFLPVIGISSKLMPMLPFVAAIYIIAFVLMWLFFYTGCHLGRYVSKE